MKGIEPIFQSFRINKIKQFFPIETSDKVLVDLGCDFEQTVLKAFAPEFKKVIGVDIVAKPEKYSNIEIINANLEKKLPLKNNSADVVTMLAVLEHLKYPEVALSEASRILKKGGLLLLTVPAAQSEPVLEFLANVGIIRREMIDQHENYFTHRRLKRITLEAGFGSVSIQSWQFGFNTFMIATK